MGLEHLHQRFHSVKQAWRCVGRDSDFFWRKLDPIGLFCQNVPILVERFANDYGVGLDVEKEGRFAVGGTAFL